MDVTQTATSKSNFNTEEIARKFEAQNYEFKYTKLVIILGSFITMSNIFHITHSHLIHFLHKIASVVLDKLNKLV